MPIADLLQDARFITNNLGEQTDVVISIDTWTTLMSVIQQIQPLEDAHCDSGLANEYHPIEIND